MVEYPHADSVFLLYRLQALEYPQGGSEGTHINDVNPTVNVGCEWYGPGLPSEIVFRVGNRLLSD